MSAALQAAARKLELSDFKAEQKQAIESALCGKDVFVTLPTGFGKSAIYQALPYCAESLEGSSRAMVLVISPLIALMRDQVSSLRAKGVRACYLGSHCSAEEDDMIVYSGAYSHVFTSPETVLQMQKWRKLLLQAGNLIAIAIDEAHCIVKW